MKKSIKVSVIVPVYNSIEYLDRCLNSLVNQTLKEIEIIVVDDGSSDDYSQILKKYEKNIIYRKNNHKGIGFTRNTGIKLAKGEYIGFVDSDDFIEKDMYKEYYNYAIKNKLDLVVGNYFRIQNKTKYIQRIPYFKIGGISSNKEILTKIDYGPCNKLFKASVLKSKKILFEEDLKYEDMPFVSKALYYSKRIGHINKAYYNYEVRDGSETTSFDPKNFDIFRVLGIFSNVFKKKYPEETEFIVVSKLLDYNIQQRNNKDKNMRNDFINQSFKYIQDNFPDYKYNKYLKKESTLKRFIKNNKIITILYCYFYSLFNRNVIK